MTAYEVSQLENQTDGRTGEITWLCDPSVFDKLSLRYILLCGCSVLFLPKAWVRLENDYHMFSEFTTYTKYYIKFMQRGQ
jgi:hypothetical protein